MNQGLKNKSLQIQLRDHNEFRPVVIFDGTKYIPVKAVESISWDQETEQRDPNGAENAILLVT